LKFPSNRLLELLCKCAVVEFYLLLMLDVSFPLPQVSTLPFSLHFFKRTSNIESLYLQFFSRPRVDRRRFSAPRWAVWSPVARELPALQVTPVTGTEPSDRMRHAPILTVQQMKDLALTRVQLCLVSLWCCCSQSSGAVFVLVLVLPQKIYVAVLGIHHSLFCLMVA